MITLHHGNDAQKEEREGRTLLVSQFPEQEQAFAAVGFGPIIIILDGGQRSSGNQSFGPCLRGYQNALACRERFFRKDLSLLQVSMHLPEPSQCSCQAQSYLYATLCFVRILI